MMGFEWVHLAAVLGLAAAGPLNLYDADGQRIGSVREGPGNTVDVYDAESRRVGWGRRNPDGSLELFDQQGRRLGEMRNWKMILKSPSFRKGKEDGPIK